MSDYIKQLERRVEELEQKLDEYSRQEIVRVPTLERTVEGHVWNDKDTVLFHVNFAILTNFIENEWGGECRQHEMLNDDSDDLARIENKEMKELYDLYIWWKEEVSANAEDFSSYNDREAKLHKLISLRRYMWT